MAFTNVEFDYSDKLCVICGGDIESEQYVNVGYKGRQALIRGATVFNNVRLRDYLLSDNTAVVRVHDKCRKNYTHSRILESASKEQSTKPPIPSKKLRSSCAPFNFREDCFLCGLHVDRKHSSQYPWSEVSTLEIGKTVLSVCDSRSCDKWAEEVRGRLETCNDLRAEDAVYHRQCYANFRLGVKHAEDASNAQKAHRPKDSEKQASFNVMCDCLENQTDRYVYSVVELRDKMIEMGYTDDDIYKVPTLKSELSKRYGDHVIFSQHTGRQDVVCLKDMASVILRDLWQTDKLDDEASHSQRVVKAAAKLIRAEIREREYNTDHYPTDRDIGDPEVAVDFVPQLLQLLLQELVSCKIKQLAIANAILQAARPRSIVSPVLLGVGVQMDHAYGSTWLVDELARLGFSVTSDEVYRFKQSVMHMEQTQASPMGCYPGRFTQWIGDNIDHNVASLDGRGSFHGMGLIAVSAVLDRNQPGMQQQTITRMKRMKAKDSIRSLGLPVKEYFSPEKRPLSTVVVCTLRQLAEPSRLQQSRRLDLLWSCGWNFRSPGVSRPGWSGFMQHVANDRNKGTSEVMLLPIVDLNPSDNTCIYSTLSYIVSQARLLNVVTPCVTFDQPLWLKAVEISRGSSLDVFCRLGGFHMLMSYIGSVGKVMAGSGLEEVLEQCYGTNTVTQMLSGKAFARALRGYFLVAAALEVLLLKQVLSGGDASTGKADCEVVTDDDVSALTELYSGCLDSSIGDVVDAVESSAALAKLDGQMQRLKTDLAAHSRTAKLWLQFLSQIDTIRMFIRAERLSDWSLHELATSRMLNLFAASGHYNYAKCGRLYLQMMQQMPETHPWLFEQFDRNGCHTVHRSDKPWTGIWTDLSIEQILMRALKSRGGLTRGRGFTESVRLSWVYTMHQCAAVHNAMTRLTGLHHKTSEQHAEMGDSRVKRDMTDQEKIIKWFENRNPFDRPNSLLCSLSSGLTADVGDGVNCDEAEMIGSDIQQQMNGLVFTDIVVKKKDAVKALIHLQKGVHVEGEAIHVNCINLFNRLILLAERQPDVSSYFSYELTPIPTSLFKDNLMRKPDKAALGRALSTDASVSDVQILDTYVVIDGGALLHRVRWGKTSTYKQTLDQYVGYVTKQYGRNVTVVFDGYCSGPSTKDHEHIRRTGRVAATVAIYPDAVVHSNQAAFLASAQNKSVFISLLMKRLKEIGVSAEQAAGDADTLICNTALHKAAGGETVTVVADDTDVLVLLVHHWQPFMAETYMKREARGTFRGATISIAAVKRNIGYQAAQRLPAIHAFSGCDTTSAVYGHGKVTCFRKLTADSVACWMDILDREDATQDEIGEAGIKLMVALFGGIPGVDSLPKLRYSTYTKLCTYSKTAVRPEQLPPTERATFFHSLRAHLQVWQWKVLSTDVANPCEWGWKMSSNVLTPVLTDESPGPDDLLNVIRCKCKMTSRNPCGTNLCSCMKNSIQCISACGNCHGNLCNNCEKSTDEDDSSSDEESYQTDVVIFDSDECLDEEVVENVENITPSTFDDAMDDEDLMWFSEETVGE